MPLIMILALHDPFVAINMVFGTALLTLNRESRWLRAGVAAAFFNLSLNIALIPLFQQATQNGAIAAAMLTVLTELVLFLGAVILLPRGLLDRDTAATSGKIVLAGVVMGLVCFAFQSMSSALAFVASAAAGAGTTAALGVFRSDDFRALTVFFVEKLSRRMARIRPAGRTPSD